MKYLQRGFSAHKAGNYVQAEADYKLHLSGAPNDHNALQLLGMLAYKNNDHNSAISWMKQSLAIDNNQPNVNNNLGNAYKKVAQFTLAKKHYQAAIDLQIDYADAWCNLLMCHYETQDYQTVIVAAQQAHAANMHHPKIARYCAMAHRELQQFTEATQSLERLLKDNPDDTNTRLELALTRFAMGDYSCAIKHYQRLTSLVQDFSIYHNLGNAYNASGDWQLAVNAYHQALVLNAEYAPTYKNLSEVYWEHNQPDKMFVHYQQALNNGINNIQIGIDYVDQLIRLNSLSTAEQISDVLYKIAPQDCDVLSQRGYLFKCKGNLQSALLVQSSILEQDWNVKGRLTQAETALEANNLGIASTAIFKVLEQVPRDQHALALLHTLHRLSDKFTHPDIDPMLVSFLTNAGINIELSEQSVFEFFIRPPTGQDLKQYLLALEQYLLGLHQSDVQPLEQTLHHGTQTHGNLFNDKNPLITHLISEFSVCVEKMSGLLDQRYRSSDQTLYPGFASTDGHYYSGSWSVKLNASGYHSNHFHPMGWLSSAFYVSLPDAVDSAGHQGWFQVGQPNLRLNPVMNPTKLVKPEVGKLVVFPSCLWHGTVPFSSVQHRLSVAFDVQKMAT